VIYEKSQSEKYSFVLKPFLAHLAKGNVSYRESAIDASYQVSIHLAQWFQRRRFLKVDQSETRIAYGGHVC
jgi:hypothetical protein